MAFLIDLDDKTCDEIDINSECMLRLDLVFQVIIAKGNIISGIEAKE